MYYQFNNFTGRLIGTHGPVQPYFPLTATPLNKQDPPKIIFGHPKDKIAQETVPSRRMSSKTVPGTNAPYGKVPETILKKMQLFQKNDGVPVYIKGGPMDKVLYGITIGLCVIGLGIAFETIYTMAVPKKQ